MEAIPYSELILFSVILVQTVIYEINKRRAESREGDLLKAIMAKHLPDYVASLETPKEKVTQMNAESKLAKEATKLEREMAGSGDLDSIPHNSFPIR